MRRAGRTARRTARCRRGSPGLSREPLPDRLARLAGIMDAVPTRLHPLRLRMALMDAPEQRAGVACGGRRAHRLIALVDRLADEVGENDALLAELLRLAQALLV